MIDQVNELNSSRRDVANNSISKHFVNCNNILS